MGYTSTKFETMKVTRRKIDFNRMREIYPERVNIVSEGDSWFAYPKKWLLFGPPSNIIDYLSDWTFRKANFYNMASNGEEAVNILSGEQKHELIEILRWHEKAKGRRPVDLLLFSGGGNDVAGENDFERFIDPDTSYRGVDIKHFIDMDRLSRKSKQISLAYQELIDIRDYYSPNTVIVGHTYDYPIPSGGAKFLGGLIETESWMKKYMDKIKIPKELQADVLRVFIDQLAEDLLSISDPDKNVHIIDTRGTLLEKNWLNEMHPNSEGFKYISNVMFGKIRELFPKLT